MLNISNNIYSCWNATGLKSGLSEAEIVPIGTSTNEKKKISNISSKYTNILEHENTPLPGFTLFEASRRTWGSLESTWLVIDPRGFLVRISNENLENILHVTGITEGLIQERCVWARWDERTKMTLVPISCPTYVEAVNNTKLIESKISVKDIQIGDTVLLQDKTQGKFMGVMSLYGTLNISHIPPKTGGAAECKPSAYLRKQVIEVSPGKYRFNTDLKILAVVNKTSTPMTKDESIKKLNKEISENKAIFSNKRHFYATANPRDRLISHVSSIAATVTLSFEEIQLSEAIILAKDAYESTDFGILMLENNLGTRFLIDLPYVSTSPPKENFQVCEILPASFILNEWISIKNHRNYDRSYGRHNTLITQLDKFVKYYKIVKHVKNETYI